MAGLDLVVELDQRLEAIGRLEVAQRWCFAPTDGIQVRQYRLRKATCDGLARQLEHWPQLAHAHTGERSGDLARQTAALDRHLAQRLQQVRLVYTDLFVRIGQHARSVRVGCGHDPVPETEVGHLGPQASGQCRPIAKQRAARADLQHQRVREIQTDLRAEAVGPGREQIAGLCFELRVELVGNEGAGQRLCRRNQHAATQSKCRRHRADRVQHTTLRRPGDQDQRAGRVRMRAQDGIHRQVRQQQANPAHVQPPQRAVAVSAIARAGGVPPRHFSTRTDLSLGSIANRSAAGDGFAASRRGRNAMPRHCPSPAAVDRRRRVRSSTFCGQHSTALQAPERRHCSAAHIASRAAVSITCRCRSSSPAQCQAGACGR